MNNRYMKYVDYLSIGIFASLLPKILFRLSINMILCGGIIITRKMAKVSSGLIYITTKINNIINIIEKYWIYILSIIFYYKSLSNYSNNTKIIKYLRCKMPQSKINTTELVTNINNAINKEGIFEVYLKLCGMYSYVSPYKHTFFTNPFLYDYSLYMTSHQTDSFIDIKKMCELGFSFIGDGYYIKTQEKTSIDDIGFTPNYYNEPIDRLMNYDNIGLQVGSLSTGMILLETICKNPEELIYKIKNKKYNVSIRNFEHDIHREILQNHFDIEYHVYPDIDNHIKVVDLIAPYDWDYHVITGFVEAGVMCLTNPANYVLEHPMICLYHDGYIMTKFYDDLNELFNIKVMKYMSDLE